MYKCKKCGTEYFESIPECDWCPGEVPQQHIINQCDGCMRGLPIINGRHELTGSGSYPGEVMGCTKALYHGAQR